MTNGKQKIFSAGLFERVVVKNQILSRPQTVSLKLIRLALNGEETLVLINGGQAFGKATGAATSEGSIGPEPEGATPETQGFGWVESHRWVSSHE